MKPKAAASKASPKIVTDYEEGIAAKAIASNGLDIPDNLIKKQEFTDFVEDLTDGGDFDDESFMATYNHVNSDTFSEDDDRYIKLVYNKDAEQAWDDSGQPIKDKKVLSKKGANKFAKEILATWKKFNQEETDSYIE